MRKKITLFMIAAATVMFVYGCVSTGQKTANSRDPANGKTVAIKPGGWFEDCNKFESGDKINITYAGSKPLEFNVHYHAKRTNEKMNIMEQPPAERYEGSIAAHGDEVHCFLWHNKNPEDVTLTFDVGLEK